MSRTTRPARPRAVPAKGILCFTALAVLAVVGAMAQAGCGGQAARRAGGEAQDDQRGILDLTNPSAPVPVEEFQQPNPALVGPGDEFELRVIGYSEYSGFFTVAPDGHVNLGLIGDVQVAGKPIAQLHQELLTAYGVYLRHFDLMLNVQKRATRNVYVLGEVARGGKYDYSTGDRVLHAVAMAGGMLPAARENSVILVRRSAGKDHAYRLDFGKVHDALPPADIYLQPGDVVFVPKDRFHTITEVASSLLDVISKTTTTTLLTEDVLRLRSTIQSVTVSR